MTDKKKALLNAVFLITVFSLTMYLVFRGEDIHKIKAVIREADVSFLLIGMVCVVFFILGESLIIFYMMRSLGAKVKMGHCALYSFVGFFFSCITPSATGGQPMQIYYMKKERLPIPVTTLGHGFLVRYMGELIWVFYVGVALNVFCVALMLVLVFAPGLAKWIMVKGLALLERFRLLRPKATRLEKLEASMDLYHETAAFWAGHKGIIFNVFVITFVQRVILFTVTYWVYRALGLRGCDIFTITVLQAVISVSVDMLPLPGGMGISETLYMVMFVPVFGEVLLPSMLLSRGIAYYGQLLLSAVMTCAAHLIIGRDKLRGKEGDTLC